MPEYNSDLIKYRLESAEERLRAAKLLLESNQLKDSINRSYYAMFTAIRALIAQDGVDFSKHSGVIAYFQRNYIKTGIFDKKFSKYISSAFQIRNNVDYADLFIVTKTDAELQLTHAVELINIVKTFFDHTGHQNSEEPDFSSQS